MSIDIPTALKANIHIEYGHLQPILDWCDRNCEAEYRYLDVDYHSDHGRWEFLFESERDYTAFMIWKK